MDLKEYRAMPDDGLFEKIERRLLRRRLLRWGGMVAGVAVVAVAAVWMLHNGNKADDPTFEGATALETHQEHAMSDLRNETAEVRYEASDMKPATASVNAECGMRNAELTEASSNANPQTQSSALHTLRSPLATLTGSENPTLPAATIQHEELPVTDLIPDEPKEEGRVAEATPQAKSGESVPETPHYDNILWAPNMLVPTADDAENRVFKVRATSIISNFQLIVYNRGGRQVFATNDINQGWDAKHNGTLVPQGTYVWVARFRDTDGVLRQEKGSVTVVR